MSEVVTVRIGNEPFRARLRRELAPRSCGCLLDLLPYTGKLTHARWSGEALWVSLGPVFPDKLLLPMECPTLHPEPGEIVLYAGGASEPELYLPYGSNRFACKAGPLEGNPVLRIETRLDRLAELGRASLWQGALDLHIEVVT